MTSEAIVKSRFPDASVRWNDMKVQIRTAQGRLLGSVKLAFLKPYMELEAAAWDDAAKNLEKEEVPNE